MEQGHILSILYEMALAIGGEVSVKPLLARMLQRLLYHTSFPAGFVCLGEPFPEADAAGMVETRLDAAIGDYGLTTLVGQTLRLPAQLLMGGAERGEDAALLAALPEQVSRYTGYLRLPIDGQGVIVLLAPQLPDSELPLTQLFQPLMANLAKAIVLCRSHDAYTGGLIAARDASQQALASSEERFRAISSAVIDALIMVDDNSILVYWNPAAERILGYRADEAVGKPLHQLLTPPRYRSKAVQGFNEFRTTGQGPVIGRTIEIEALHKDGREIPVELSISALKFNGRWHAVGVLRDITEKKRMEDELRQANVYNRSLIEASVDPLVTISVEGKITDVNQATEKVTGRSRAELIGTDFSDYFTEPDRARDGYRQVFANGFVTDYPLALRHRDGHVTEVLYNASVYRDEAGAVLGVFAAARDVTERNKAEQEVRQLSLQNRLILDSTGEGIYGLDIDGRCTFANPAASHLLGFDVEELLGRHSHTLIHHTRPDGSPYPDEECPVQTAYKQGVVHRGNDLYWRKDGSSFPVEFISTPILEAGKITGAVVAFRDITERKLAEEQLQRSEHGLAEAQRIAHLGNWELNLENNALTWSDEIYRIFEIDREKFGASYDAFLNAIHPDDRDMVNNAYTDSVRNKVPYDIVHRLQMPDGRIKYVNEKCETYYGKDGKPLRSVGTVHDITDRKLDEVALQQLNRELRAISNCNQTLMRAEDEQTLLDDICRIICDDAGYRMAWVGYPENDEAKTIRIVSRAGAESGYLEQAKLTWADTERGHGPSGTAIRTGKSVSIQDFMNDSQAAPWRDAAMQRGYRSSISLPLKDEHAKTFGILNIYAAMANAFTPAEIRLLEELAGDMAFGIMVLRSRIEGQRAGTALRESEEKYRTLIQKIQAAVIVHGSDTQILTSNSAAQKILGLSEEQLLGKLAIDPAWYFLREDGTAASLDEYPVNRVLASRKALRNHILGVHRPNQKNDVWVLVNADPVFGKEDELAQIIVTFIDITERVQAEQALRVERGLFVAGPSVVFKWRAQEGWPVEYVSPNVASQFGYAPEDLTSGKVQYAAIVHPDDIARVGNEVSMYSEQGVASFEQMYRIAGADGRYRWIEDFTTIVRGLDGTITHYLGYLQDITERKQAEEEIRKLNLELEQRVADRTAQLEAANKELEAFAYSVSHDLRTPLRAIDGFSHILLEDYAGKLDDEGKRLLNVVRDNANRMNQLIDDILRFSRAGRLEINFVEIDMEKMAQSVFAELQPAVAASKLQLEIGHLPPARGDNAMMHQVFVNLLSNAIKFSRNRDPAVIKVGAYIEGDEAVYYVKDNGAGFDMQFADKLFGVFQRLHSTTEFEGTGIGLAIVKRIVARHGGRVWAEGKVNEGATMYFSIPVQARSSMDREVG